MLWVGIGAVIGLGFTVYRTMESRIEHALVILTGLVAGGCAGLILALLIGIVTNSSGNVVLEKEFDLVALNDIEGIHGFFHLGTGRIGTEFYYVYYYQEPDGTIRLGKILAENEKVVLHEGQRNHAILQIKREMGTLEPLWATATEEPRYEFYLPEGSVVRNISLNLND